MTVFRLLRGKVEVGRVVVDEASGRFEARWPEDMPAEERAEYEAGRGPFWRQAANNVELAEYWHYALTVGAGYGWWDRVETDYRPPRHPTRGPSGETIVY